MSLLNELEDIHTYLDKEDTFFFTMVYDPNQKTLLVDKGEIRVGTDYQAEIPPYVDPGKPLTYGVFTREVDHQTFFCVLAGVAACAPALLVLLLPVPGQRQESQLNIWPVRCGNPTGCQTTRWSSFWLLPGEALGRGRLL